MDKQYKFEVAFSFLERDEALAYQINDLISDRLSTFIYSQHQFDLAAKDGQTSFRRVFAIESRMVVVLYRPDWGNTNWTRVEEEAIEDRRLKESSDFIVLINVERGKPEWYSSSHIRLDLERHSIEQLAAVIEDRVASRGGNVRTESADDMLARQKREVGGPARERRRPR
ncbi:MAG TPA: hypothetical protein PK760_15025, partial [Flavobacteriales bacterium]|nr:hypothetical protein [Flavobacteriales bacterium]